MIDKLYETNASNDIIDKAQESCYNRFRITVESMSFLDHR